jgi:dTDP-4-amino-4,6-dideoxygalactose transaminase
MSERREIPFGRPWITDSDREAVLRVLSGHILTHGPEGKAFEAEFGAFMGERANCVAVSSCMAALHMTYLHLGLTSGDEVIAPALTHVATAHAIEWVGARPVFVDCERATGNLTAAAIAGALTPRTKAIALVHFAGIPCEMPAIMELAHARGLKVVEDCAIALGARFNGIHVGLFGDAGAFSFYPVKHITTGEGGMFVSRFPEVAGAIGKLRAFGVDRSHAERSVPGMYEVPSLGLNYRMSEMQAALGRAQIARISENLRRRRDNFETLKGELGRLPGLRILEPTNPAAQNSHYCLIAVLPAALASRRNEIMATLTAAGVGTSIYYPQPVPRMEYYRKKYGYDPERFPAATEISDGSIALPVGQHLDPDDMRYVARAFSAALAEG